MKARKATAALSTARAVVDAVHSIHCGTAPGEFVSLGVWAKGDRQHGNGNVYGVSDENMYFSLPVSFQPGGSYRIRQDLKVSAGIKTLIKSTENALKKERDLAQMMIDRHDYPKAHA